MPGGTRVEVEPGLCLFAGRRAFGRLLLDERIDGRVLCVDRLVEDAIHLDGIGRAHRGDRDAAGVDSGLGQTSPRFLPRRPGDAKAEPQQGETADRTALQMGLLRGHRGLRKCKKLRRAGRTVSAAGCSLVPLSSVAHEW